MQPFWNISNSWGIFDFWVFCFHKRSSLLTSSFSTQTNIRGVWAIPKINVFCSWMSPPISIYVFSALWGKQPTIVRLAFVQCTQWTCPSTYLTFPQFWKSRSCSMEISILFNANNGLARRHISQFLNLRNLNFFEIKSQLLFQQETTTSCLLPRIGLVSRKYK